MQTGVLGLGTEFTVEETALPVESSLYVCGKAEGNAIGAPSWRMLLISNKTRDQLLESATQDAKRALFGGAAAMLFGSAVAAVGGLIAGPAPARAPVAASVAPSSNAGHAAAPPPASPPPAATPATPATPPVSKKKK